MTDTTSSRPADFRKVSFSNSIPAALSDYPGYLTPPQIATAYNIPASTGAGVKIGIFSLGGGFKQSDLNLTFADLVSGGLLPPGTIAPTIKQVLLDDETGTWGSYAPGDSENTLDIYCIATLVPDADITIYIGNYWETVFNRAITDGCHIITFSWVNTENAGNYLATYLTTAETNKIAITAASGDWGSSLTGETVLDALYPSSNPKVISIGGTKLILNSADNSRDTETDDNRDPDYPSYWGGGGGVSKNYALPSWQSGLHYTPIINGVTGTSTTLTMRGVPDISAPMNTYIYYENGVIVGSGGTSASAPVIAGMLARIQALTGKQRSSAEYNTLFYNHKNSFFDITVGTNNTQITSGYAGTVDWDPVTGLGPPIGNKVFQYMRNGLRPTSGGVFPNHKFDRRPTTGMVWPRTKTL